MANPSEITVKLRLDLDDRAREALIAMGWTPPEGPGPRCRYCGGDCSGGRSYDGDGLYACTSCASDRAARRGRFAPSTGEATT
ncbi:hypothetical protein GCM10027258_62750 [Amycolatopsis stemonae]